MRRRAVRLAEGPTVPELAQRFLEEHVEARCKPNTAEIYRLVIGKHILPAPGKMPALAVEYAHVAKCRELVCRLRTEQRGPLYGCRDGERNGHTDGCCGIRRDGAGFGARH